ncbi:MAG: DUF4199 domain-containing protein [Flavobacteriaceae bacterium]|jgi:hypothetical protein|nr:DUF4199 domain-containing protein [Flavobacteriaceae bacterium]
MEIDVKKISADLGIKLGLLLFLSNTVFYVIDMELFLNWTISLIFMFIIIGSGIYSILNSRKKLGGYINWSDAFVSYMACTAVGMLIAALTQIFIFVILDPVAAEQLNEMSMIMVKEMYTGMNLSEEMIQQALIEMEKNPSLSLSNLTLSLAVGLGIQAIFGSINALIFKRSNPEIA